MTGANGTPATVRDIVAVLATVDQLLSADRPGSRRTVVRLLRVAVESTVDGVWRAAGRPGVCDVSRRAQFLVLGQVVDADTAHATAAVWGALSAAGHHHAYELTPTAAELAGWRADTGRCVTALPDLGSRGSSRGAG